MEGCSDGLLALLCQNLCTPAWWSPSKTWDSQHLDQGSKPGPSEYEVGLLTTGFHAFFYDWFEKGEAFTRWLELPTACVCFVILCRSHVFRCLIGVMLSHTVSVERRKDWVSNCFSCLLSVSAGVITSSESQLTPSTSVCDASFI